MTREQMAGVREGIVLLMTIGIVQIRRQCG